MKLTLILISFIIFTSCISELSTGPSPVVIDIVVWPLNESVKQYMNGIYEVVEGKNLFGDRVKCSWVGRRFCIHSEHDVVYSVNSGGFAIIVTDTITVSDSIILSGFARIVRSGAAYNINLYVKPGEGANNLSKSTLPQNLMIRGNTWNGTNIVLKKIKGLKKSGMHILAHRGGGRNSERLGISENSIEMMLHAQYLGATGAEIDVKRTKDGKLIIFHDDTFSPRTVSGSYLLGEVENFTLEQVKLFGHLINGESIPTLEEALDTLIDKTSLSLLWLDIKDPGIVDKVILEQQKAIIRAKEKNRDIMILLGIPDQAVLNAYKSSKYANTTDILIELSLSDALELPTCRVWAPRWTNEISNNDISLAHNDNILVFTWTLDVQEYISKFISEKKIDGILSNYPSLVTGMYYCN